LERGLTSPHAETLQRIRKALERAGIEFMSGGWRLKQGTLDVQVFEGREALFRPVRRRHRHLYRHRRRDLYQRLWREQIHQGRRREVFEYLKWFSELGIVDILLARDGDANLVVPAKYYRWVPEEIFLQVPYMIYGDKYAILLWGPPVKIVLIQNAAIADSYRKQFKAHWRRGKAPSATSWPLAASQPLFPAEYMRNA
jgi:hypothetical protein